MDEKTFIKKKNKVLVVYLISKFDDPISFKYFLINYQKYNPGHKHKLLICFKQLDNKKVIKFENKLKEKKIKYECFYDSFPINDYDFGSYFRIAKKFKDYLTLFMNCHCRPVKKNWLKKLIANYDQNTLIGVAGSYSSYASNSFFRNNEHNYFQYIINIIKCNILFSRFPNPHIRSSCFLISSLDYINFIKSSKIVFKKKYHTWMAESSKIGMSNFFKKKNFKLLVINSKGKDYDEKNWKLSNTFCTENQEYLLISDKHSRVYQQANRKQKDKISQRVWGS